MVAEGSAEAGNRNLRGASVEAGYLGAFTAQPQAPELAPVVSFARTETSFSVGGGGGGGQAGQA